MTIGIYKLQFNGTNKVYIGQSVNIEARHKKHIYNMRANNTSDKLQYAYNTYGEPKYEILHECTPEELDKYEIQYISLYDSYEDGLNSTVGGELNPVLVGTSNPNSMYKEEDYFNVLYFLGIPGYSWKEIAKITGVSKYVISHISSLESHNWLKDKFPEEYAKVEAINRNGGRNYATMQGIVYPLIKSPSGEVYQVHHQTNFAKEHGLSQPKLCEVLHGNRKSHKGWTLV